MRTTATAHRIRRHCGSPGAVAVSIVLAVVFNLDPAAQFYTWFAGATTVGFVVLLIATSVAVLAFFALTAAGTRCGGVGIAPALGLVGLLGSLILILANLSDLVGGSSVPRAGDHRAAGRRIRARRGDRHAGQRQQTGATS